MKGEQTLRSPASTLVPLLILAHFSHHVLTAITAPLLPLIRTDFGLSYTQAGLMVSAYTLAYGAGHLVVGWLMDRVRPRYFMTMGISGVALCGVLISLAPAYWMLVVFQFLLGATGSGYHPASTTVISRSVPAERRGRALGVHIIGGSASFFLSPLLAGAIAVLWGWRGAFLGLALPTLALGVAVFLLLRRFEPRERGVVTEEKRVEQADTLFSWPVIIPFLLLTALGGSLIMASVNFVPLMVVDTLGVPEERAAALMALVFSAGLWVAPLAGWLSDRVGRLPLLIGVSILIGPVIAALSAAPYGALFFALLILVGVYIFVRMPVSESFILGEVKPAHRSAILGFYFFGSSAFGAVCTPVVGRLADREGFPAAFRLLAVGFVVLAAACAVAIWLGARARRARSAATPGAQ